MANPLWLKIVVILLMVFSIMVGWYVTYQLFWKKNKMELELYRAMPFSTSMVMIAGWLMTLLLPVLVLIMFEVI